MYDKEDLKMKLKAYSEMKDCNLMGFVPILEKSLRERFKENSIHTIPPYMEESLQDIVSKCVTVTTTNTTELPKIEYNIEKMCGVFDIYFDKLVSVINFENARHNMIIDEIKKKEKPKTFSKVSRIISRVNKSKTMNYPTYHDWKWFDTTTEDINEILQDKTLSEYEFEVEFISTDTMSIAEGEDKFKVITVMYFKLTEYIPDEE